jgi:hypothetical protein
MRVQLARDDCKNMQVLAEEANGLIALYLRQQDTRTPPSLSFSRRWLTRRRLTRKPTLPPLPPPELIVLVIF